MGDRWRWWWWWWWWSFGLLVVNAVKGGEVTYDGRSLIIDGQHKLLFSGSIHYPRSTPDMWSSLISKAKNGGIDVIETYIFWNLHEPQPGQYDFSGGKDIVRFIKEIQAQGLYAFTRIGPFIESEWNYGGFPFWLHDVPGIVFRSDNEPFMFYMQNFTTKIVELFKSEGLYASQGGPIILSQIENEYQNVEKGFGEKGPPYVKWAAEMAVGLQTGVPWVMCKQDDAPDPVINTCNGMRCGETFVGPNSPNKPAIWTEDWTSFYQTFGDKTPLRSAEDIAFHVALFIAKMNGSFINYYMYHGGTNFGRTTSSYVITSYYDEAPLDEYGLFREPKWGHLKELHTTIKSCSKTLISGVPSTSSLGEKQEAYVFLEGGGDEGGGCVAFLVNRDKKKVVVQFRNSSFELPPSSISILPDCVAEAFNTAKVSSQSSSRSIQPIMKFDSNDRWEEFSEAIPSYDETSVRSNMLLEHMNTTKDKSDYLWYTTSFEHSSSVDESTLSVYSWGHVLHIFVNGILTGSAHGSHKNSTITLDSSIHLNQGTNNISLLSATVGLPDSGAFLERRAAGLYRVTVQDSQETQDLTNSSWGYQVGMRGENLKVFNEDGSSGVEWKKFDKSSKFLTWYKTRFDAPGGDDPLALNLGSMGKGEVWINGQSIGRYWISFRKDDGFPSQTWYHVPRSFLKPKNNQIVLFEEEEGNPIGITLDSVSITKVCRHVSDTNLQQSRRFSRVHLSCPLNTKISKILFASFGNPTGNCESFALGKCHSSNSTQIVEKECIGRRKCYIPKLYKRFGDDPCPGIPKALLIEAQCQ